MIPLKVTAKRLKNRNEENILNFLKMKMELKRFSQPTVLALVTYKLTNGLSPRSLFRKKMNYSVT